MNNAVPWILCGVAGVVLGALFFGGLWWTTREALAAEHPSAWFAVSFPIRVLITLGGFYFVGRGDWRRLVVCLLGWLMVRTVVTSLTPRPAGAAARLRTYP